MRPLLFAVLLSSLAASSALAQDATNDARISAARRSFELARTAADTGTGTVEDVYTWSLRLLASEREAAPARAAAAYAAHLQRMAALQSAVQQRVATGMAPQLAATSCEYYVAEARVWVAHPPR